MQVNPSFPEKTIHEFIDYGKANPGRLNFASSVAGSPGHLGALATIAVAVDNALGHSLHVGCRGQSSRCRRDERRCQRYG
jgi:tripartite-type tricarboxylate transporter receptor subunit TctC